MQLNYAIVFVSDMKRSVAFYRDVVGLPLRFESPGWTEFAGGGANLALHATEPGAAKSSPPLHAAPGTCRPGFGVADLDAFHRRMTENNVTCVQPPKNVFGTRVAQYADPDGLVFSVGEQRGT
jgi:lactoylglutathione lyase